jgi:diguanylate cyclase (GGDEF)-like protein/PAS domain S-box-containing protein
MPEQESETAPSAPALEASDLNILLRLQNQVLEAIARGRPLAALEQLCLGAERLVPQAVCSVMLLDPQQRLQLAAAPSLPPLVREQLNGLQPGPGAGSCGNAIDCGEPVFVTDVINDSRWDDLRQLAEQFEIGACWSFPVFAGAGSPAGSFAITSFERRQPTAHHRVLLQTGAYLAGIALQSHREQEALRRAGIVFDNTAEGILVTDTRGVVLEVNRAFTDITGYTPEQAVGRSTAELFGQSQGRAAIHVQLNDTGAWSGELQTRRVDGTTFPAWTHINHVRDADGRISHFVGVISDISSIKRTEQRLSHLAHHDTLTGLPNRLLFGERLDQALSRRQRRDNHLAVLFLDLDRFKNINDSEGHHVGDQLLKRVAARLHDSLRREDTIARLGGDEFVVLAEDLGSHADAECLAQKMLNAMAEPLVISDKRFTSACSIGIAVAPEDGVSAEELLQNADTAMYRAKASGRNTLCFYTPELTASARNRLALENDLRSALAQQQFSVHYQPQVNWRGQTVAVEALLRWQHPQHGAIPPEQFIGVAEETGLISPIGDWLIREACNTVGDWQRAGLPRVRLAFNVSRLQLGPQLRDCLVAACRDSGLTPAELELELTESTATEQVEHNRAGLQTLLDLGVDLAIDDFGTGYSSLGELKHLPARVLKIDRRLVRDIVTDPKDAAIVHAVVAMAIALDLVVVAEGVETAEQFRRLRQEGCDRFQGLHISAPMPAEQMAAYLAGARQARR